MSVRDAGAHGTFSVMRFAASANDGGPQAARGRHQPGKIVIVSAGGHSAHR